MRRVSEQRRLGATAYLEDRLTVNPESARFSHCLAALYKARKRVDDTSKTYKNAIRSAPSDVMIRNDYALHLLDQDRKQDAVDEINKAMLVTNEQPTLHMSLGAIEASRGNYTLATQSTNQAMLLNPRNASNLRNHAKVQAALGDTRAALDLNIRAMRIEGSPNTQCYRTAAVQNITLGGDREYSVQLLTAARSVENKKFTKFEHCSVQRTDELLTAIARRKEQPSEALERMLKAAADKKALEDAVRHGDVRTLLKHKFGKA